MYKWEIGVASGASMDGTDIRWTGEIVEADNQEEAFSKAISLGFYRNLRICQITD